MKEQDIIEQKQAFRKLVNDILNYRVNRGEYTAVVGERTFTIYTGVGLGFISVDNIPDKNVIHLNGSTIKVIDQKIAGKKITYHLRQETKLTEEIAEDILAQFI